MTTPHEAIAAWPVTGNADKALARALATRRLPYALASTESLANFALQDPATGVVPLYVVQNGSLFEYDPLDTTTVASAVCLVSGDTSPLRYKSGGITPPDSVLTYSTTAQPVSPSIGDRYLIPTAATGTNWAGKDGKVGVYSRAGWQFVIIPIGRGLYVEDTNTRYYRNAAGTWTSGFGAAIIGAAGINITQILGTKASFVVKVENQTTNTPPASPVAPVAYIVGPVPAGGWSAYSPGDLAICLVSGTFTRIVPAAGDIVYDKALALPYTWSGSVWQTASGELIPTDRYYVASTTWAKPARLSFVDVYVVAGGAGSGGSSNGGNGGASSFGSHCSATGGAGGQSVGGGGAIGADGSGSGGDYNHPNGNGVPYANGVGGGQYQGTSAGGRGGASRKRILAATLGSSETVTIGAAGSAGSGGGVAGVVGLVHVREWTRA